ncbi:MAG: ABC transporter substrate-binding protein [Paenibacillaceae bacterium ZCTH02-B3]|nr:MAG: ABC transporter substrate-binding protein [Paenibacillaceae bacterium ZCTH02-B3]
MRKPLSVLLVLLVSVAMVLAACGQGNSGSGSGSSSPAASPSPSPSGSSAPSPSPSESPKIDYPTKAIELIVPFAAGGGTDAVGRATAEALKKELGVDVVVVNKTGGGGAVGMQDGLSAKPDGYTITVVTREVVSLPLLGQAPFQTMDFRFIGNVNRDPAVLVVPTDSPYQTAEALIEAIKNKPGSLKFAASVVPNYYGIQFAEAAGLDFITIPFNGAAPAIVELLGKRADFGIYNPGEVKAQVDGGNLKPLAVMAEERFPGFPDVPTFREIGYDIVSGTYRGLAVPKETPEEIVKILEDALAKAVEDPDLIAFMENSFLGRQYMDSETYTKFIEEDIKILTPIIEIAKQQM